MTEQALILTTKPEALKSLMLNGMFLGLVGETGAGKTLTLTWFAFHFNEVIKDEPDMKIYANFHLRDVPEIDLCWDYEYMYHPDELLSLPKYSIPLLDDMWRWCLDSYKNSSKIMQKYDEIQASGRKRGYLIVASLQRFMRIDPNFRINIQYLIQPTTFFDLNWKPYQINLVVVDNHNGKIESRFDINPYPIIKYKMYDTTEEIKPIDEQERFSWDEIVEKFIDWNTLEITAQQGKKVKVQQKITQDSINAFLVDYNLYNYMTKDDRGILKAKIQRRTEI